MDITSLPQLWGLLAGLLLPGLTAVIQQPHWSRQRRVFIAVVASVVLGTLTAFASGQLDFSNWVTTVGAVVVAAQTAYESLWQPSGAAAAIENHTSGVGNPEVDYQTNVDDFEGEVDPSDPVDDSRPLVHPAEGVPTCCNGADDSPCCPVGKR